MNHVFRIFLSLSLSGSLMILLLFLCRHFWKDRISRQWQYYIWLVVIARLLLPFAPEANLMEHIFQTDYYAIVQAGTASNQQEPDYLHDMEHGFTPNTGYHGQGGEKMSVQTGGSQPIQEIVTLLSNNIWLVWLITAFVLLIRKMTVYQSFVHYVKAGQTFVSDIVLLDQLSVLVEKAGMKKPVELCVNPLISSPLLIGFFRPCIVLPSTDLAENNFSYIVLHELTHHWHLDILYKWMVQITVCLHWFNPLVYIMSREINKACEFSCDEAIIAKLDESRKEEYGKTLLDAMVNAGTYKESLASVTLNESKEMLKERLGAIMNYKKKSNLTKTCTMILTAAILCMTVFTGAYAAAPDHAETKTNVENDNGSPKNSTVVIDISNSKDQKNLIHSSSFQAVDGQILTLEIKSNIKGTVDLFLFSPSFQEQRITIGGRDDTITVDLSEGTWAYNCTGFFDSGEISIVGTIE